MINKTHIRAWVKALRSGKYRRGTSYLAQRESGRWKYCCLGVACEVARIPASQGVDDCSWIKHYGEYPNSRFLPTEAMDFFGLSTGNPARLADLNDEGWSFRRIASHIEEVFLKGKKEPTK